MRKRDGDAELIKAAARLKAPTVYALAKRVGRPYRRVLERVKTLATAGHLTLVPAVLRGRPVLEVHVPKPSGRLPGPFPVTWSRPRG